MARQEQPSGLHHVRSRLEVGTRRILIAPTSHSWLPTVTSPAPAVRTADHVLLRRATLARCREVTANCRSTQTGRLLGTGPAERLASQQRDHPSWQRARDIDRRVSCIASGLSQIRSSVKSDPAGLKPP